MNALKYYNPSEKFLEEEEICGFWVTRQRKKSWAIELDLLLAFQDVCGRYDLKYWMFGGSMLGTARHNGFIPWDDDIDIIMPRKDYDKLLEIGPDAFADPYIFENASTEKCNVYYTHSKLRNEETADIIEASEENDKGHGLWIDIFALDYAVSSLVPLHYFVARTVRLLFRILHVSKACRFKLWNWHERVFRNMKYDGYMQGMRPRAYRFYPGRQIWEGSVERDFCGIKVPVPQHYKEILTMCYGDWTKFIVKAEHFKLKDEKSIGSRGF